MEHSQGQGNTRPPYLSPEKPVLGQEATVRAKHGTKDCFKIEKLVLQSCILSPCFFLTYIQMNISSGIDESQAGIKTDGRNINNLRYADDTTLMVESKENESNS